MRACLTKYTKVMGFAKDVFLPSSLLSDPLIIVREKETTMRRVSLNKIRLSMIAKVPGMLILGVLAIAFLLFPLAALAQCGGGGQAAQAGTLESDESLFSPKCGGTPLSTAQASELTASWAQAPKAKNATIGTTAPKTTTTTPKTSTTPNSGVLSGLSLLGAVARCSFVTVPNDKKVQLADGDICLVTLQNKDGSDTAIIAEVVGGKLVAVAGNNGKHFARLVQNPNIKLSNAILPQE